MRVYYFAVTLVGHHRRYIEKISLMLIGNSVFGVVYFKCLSLLYELIINFNNIDIENIGEKLSNIESIEKSQYRPPLLAAIMVMRSVMRHAQLQKRQRFRLKMPFYLFLIL